MKLFVIMLLLGGCSESIWGEQLRPTTAPSNQEPAKNCRTLESVAAIRAANVEEEIRQIMLNNEMRKPTCTELE